MIWKILVLSFLCLFFSPAPAQASGGAEEASTAFKDIRVFDGEKLIERCTVLVQGGAIVQVGKGVAVPKGAEVISGRDLTLLPGLIDAHVHVFSLGNLTLEAMFGVTTVMDMMNSKAFMQQAKAKLRAGAEMADFYCAGDPATCPGGHGSEWGSEIPTLAGPQDAAGFVSACIDAGSDYIKIMAGIMAKKALDRETIAAVAAEAKKKGLLTLAHTETRSAALAALSCGVMGLAHCFADLPPDAEFIRVMKERKGFVIPTLSVMHRLNDAWKINMAADARLTSLLEPEVVSSLAEAKFPPDSDKFFYKVAEETARLLHEAGIPVLAGSDSGNPGTVHGASLHVELERLVHAGLAPAEVLQSATSLPAAIFGLQDRGRVEPGRRADLLLVKGDPIRDIAATRNIEGVWLRGHRLDREPYLAALRKLHEEWKQSGEIPPPLHAESGVICDFDAGDFAPLFGMHFYDMSDRMMGGASAASIKLAGDGAEGTKGSLAISGHIEKGFPMPWAGAAFFPGATESSIANLSRWNAVSFWARSDSGSGAVMTMLSKQEMPGLKPLALNGEWRKYEVPFKDLGSADGRNIWAFVFGAVNSPGPFSIQIDNVRLIRIAD